jgi:hypothetical protein
LCPPPRLLLQLLPDAANLFLLLKPNHVMPPLLLVRRLLLSLVALQLTAAALEDVAVKLPFDNPDDSLDCSAGLNLDLDLDLD